MEYKFLDSKLPVDLTNLIASFVGPKSNKYVKKINKLMKKTKQNKYNKMYNENLCEYDEYMNEHEIDSITEDEFNSISEEYFIKKFHKQYFKAYKEQRDERLWEIENEKQFFKSINHSKN